MNKQSDINWNTVLKLLAGGAVTGAGIGAGTSFVRYLQSLSDQAGATSAADDDVLYVDLPPRTKALGRRKMANSAGTFAMSGLAAILGTILSYGAVRELYQRTQKKRMQKELDSAQNIYLGGLTTQTGLDKGAKAAPIIPPATAPAVAPAAATPTAPASPSGFGFGARTGGLFLLAMMLTALGSGVVSNKLLQKTFPPIKSPNRTRPRKIVIRSKGLGDEPTGADEEVVTPKGGVSPDSLESLVRSNMSVPKMAQYDGMTSDLVMAAACGRCDEIRENIASYGVDAALDMVKGARHENPSDLNKHLAVTWVCNDPLVSEAMKPIIAAEFYDWAPWCCKLASYIPEEYHDNLVGLATAACQEVRAATFKNFKETMPSPVDLTKVSTALDDLLLPDTLKMILKMEGKDQTQNADQMRTPDSQTNVPVSEESPVLPSVELSTDEAKKFWKRYGSLVDNAMEKVEPGPV